MIAPSMAARSFWAKGGQAFYYGKCESCGGVSPDKSLRINPRSVGEDDMRFGVFRGSRLIGKIKIPYGTMYEILWSPDSKAFAISVSTNAYSETSRVWRVVENRGEEVHVAEPVFRDMAKVFPPCAGENADPEICKRLEADPEFNLLAVAWAGPHTVVMMGEVPCSSSYGGMMCQVRGYEIDVNTGSFVRVLRADELKRRWQSHMRWKFRIPEPPMYAHAKGF